MPPVFTVSQLAERIKGVLDAGFKTVDLEGEISVNTRSATADATVAPSSQGHYYFSLKDSGAIISAVFFRWQFEACVKSGLLRPEDVRNGAKVKVRGSVTLYPQRGNCQIVIRRMRIAGAGDLMRRYLELKMRLEVEGLFSPARKRPLPYMPRRIGLLTSEGGAVVHDMCNVLLRRFPDVQIRLFPCVVQGPTAPDSLITGLNYFNSLSGDWIPDLLIVARGGGSFEDLFCFNDETFVRALVESRIPTISAVGHETDFTLCDFVADKRAGTPSIAAEIAVPEEKVLHSRISQCSDRMTAALRGRGESCAQHVDHLAASLGLALTRAKERVEARLTRQGDRLSAAVSLVFTQTKSRIDRSTSRFTPAITLALTKVEGRLEKAKARLDLLSPYGVLERGYSLTTDASGAVIRDAGQVKSGERLTTRLAKGSVVSIAS